MIDHIIKLLVDRFWCHFDASHLFLTSFPRLWKSWVSCLLQICTSIDVSSSPSQSDSKSGKKKQRGEKGGSLLTSTPKFPCQIITRTGDLNFEIRTRKKNLIPVSLVPTMKSYWRLVKILLTNAIFLFQFGDKSAIMMASIITYSPLRAGHSQSLLSQDYFF